MFKKLWNIHNQQKSRKLDLSKRLKSIERQNEQLVDRIVDTDNQTLTSTHETKITKLEKVIEKTNMPFSLHDLRRTFASIAESLNLGSSYTLKRLLNHKTNRNDVTAGYTILTAEELREPAQQIEDKILELAGIKEPPSQVPGKGTGCPAPSPQTRT